MGGQKEGEPNRIYNVPPERREGVFRLRTAGLQAYHKLKEEGRLPPLSAREARKAAEMPLPELVESLRDYPLLLSYVLETMTDEEFEQYVESSSNAERNPTPVQRVKRFFSGFLRRSKPQGKA